MGIMNTGVLVLEDGTQFSGQLFGAPVTAQTIRTATPRDFAYGEVVFNTSMTGYQEILTDPSYFGQMICMTVPHVGNTGINAHDGESAHPWCAGFIVHEYCEEPSHYQSEQSLDTYLKAHQIPGISGIDTRALTRHLRSRGVLRGLILPTNELDADPSLPGKLLRELPAFEGRDMIRAVSTKKSFHRKSAGTTEYQVVAMDFGIKENMLRALTALGCQVEVVPATTTAAEILAMKPDGVFLSNGPGDPTAADYAVRTIQDLLGKVHIFGVCMGHQLLGLALGGKIYKLKFGHRGGNQPVIEHATGRVEISSHNHGYSIDAASLSDRVEVTHLNLNDKTVEGLRAKNFSAFSVQYHPEACPGPHDSMLLFDRFITNMKNNVPKIS